MRVTSRHRVRMNGGRGRSAALSAVLALASVPLAAPALARSTPADGRIAFVAESGGQVKLYTVRPDGRGLRQLVRLTGDASSPDWSPDGRYLVFAEDLGDAGSRIEKVRADGGDVYVFPTEPGAFDGAPSFTPDGNHILFERFNPTTGRDAIRIMNFDGSDQRDITSGNDLGVTAAKMSPDGRVITFVGGDANAAGPGLFAVRPDGSHLRQIVPTRADLVDKQDWSPNGRRIAASDNHDHLTPGLSENLFTIRPDGTNRRYLTHFSGGDVNAVMGSFSPDGRSLAFRLEDHGRYGLYRIDRRTRSMQAILPLSELKPRYIDWGPAAPSVPGRTPNTIIYTTAAAGDVQTVWQLNRNEIRQLTEPGQVCCLTRIAPDGRHLLVMPGGDPGVPITGDVLDLHTSTLRRLHLTDPTLNLVPQAWSPDGRRIAFEGWDDADPSRTGVYIARVDGTNLRRVTARAGTPHDIPLDFSPNGRQLVLYRSVHSDPDPATGGSLWVVNIDGSNAHPVTTTADPPAPWARWSPDGRTILFATERLQPIGLVQTVRPDGTRRRVLLRGEADRFPITPDWSPDGSQIALAIDPTNDEFTHPVNGLYRMTADGRDLRLVVATPDFKRSPEWLG